VAALTAVWFRDPLGGLFAGAIAAALPEQLLWARTAASEPTASLFAALAVFAWTAFVRLRTTDTLLWAIATTAFAVQMRPESVLLLPLAAAILLLLAPEELRRPRLWVGAALGVVLCAGLAAHLVAVRGESWGASAERLSLDFVGPNLATNARFYLWDSRFPWVVTLLAAAGVAAGRKYAREAGVAIVWFALFFGVYLLFYAGSYNFGADVRYSLMTYPPLAALAGLGASWIVAAGARAPSGSRRLTAAVLACVLLFAGAAYLPLARAVGEEAWAARADVEFARSLAAGLPANSIVLTHNPNMFLLWGRSAAQMSLATHSPEYVRDRLFRTYRGGVFLHWNFWCNAADEIQQRLCRNLLADYEHHRVDERTVRDYRFALYELKPPDR
jgi:hypothetical protein